VGRWLLLLAGSVGTAALDKSENTDTRNNAIDFSALGFLVMGTRGASLLAVSMGAE